MTLPPMITCGSRHNEPFSNQTLTYTPSINPIARARITSLDVTFFGTFMLTTESGSATGSPGSPRKQPSAMESIASTPRHTLPHSHSVRSAAVGPERQEKPESVKKLVLKTFGTPCRRMVLHRCRLGYGRPNGIWPPLWLKHCRKIAKWGILSIIDCF